LGEELNIVKRVALLVDHNAGFCSAPIQKRDDLGVLTA
jgi:hypothetical protein